MDPNVLVSAAISSRGAPRELLLAWHSDLLEMIVSYDLLYELEAVLMRPRFRRKLAFSDVIEYVMWIRERSRFAQKPLVSSTASRDPDDNYLHALALVHTARLVSGDKDLLSLGTRGLVPVYSPREFVDMLR